MHGKFKPILIGLCLLGAQLLTAQEKLTITVTPGKNWESKMWICIVPVAKMPQIAAWIETTDGEYVTTLMVTGRAAKKEWRGSPEAGRPESLPVWYHASRLAGGDIDAASSATPSGSAAVVGSASSLVPGKEYVVRLEVNHSFDYNDAWTKKGRLGDAGFSGVNGQPSLIYECRIVAGQTVPVVLKPVGTGSVDGSDGRIRAGTSGLTTALSIIATASVVYQ